MDIVNSLLTSVFGMSVVFAVLVSLILLIYLQSYLLKLFHREKAVSTAEPTSTASPATTAMASPTLPSASAVVRPELKLYNVDEKTAAMVMAIVCAESDIPANELVFKSIRLIESPSAS